MVKLVTFGHGQGGNHHNLEGGEEGGRGGGGEGEGGGGNLVTTRETERNAANITSGRNKDIFSYFF